MKTQLAFFAGALLLLNACATATPENPGRFMSHAETIARCGVSNYTFRNITDCSSAPATVAQAAPKAEPAPVVVPEPSLRKQVYFKIGSSKVAATHNEDIAAAADAMKANTNARVEVQGFADASGDLTKNEALSKRRAQAVHDAIVAKGIDSSRIEMVKPSQAVGDATADASKKANDRRVEIRVY